MQAEQVEQKEKPVLRVIGHHWDGYCTVVKFSNGQEAGGPDPLRLQRTVDRVLDGSFKVRNGWPFGEGVGDARAVERM